MNNIIKKEFSVSKGLFIPVYRNIPSAPEPAIGGMAYDNSTQGLLLSEGISWYPPYVPSTPTGRGTVFGTTSAAGPSATGFGNLCGTAAGENVFVGYRSGQQNFSSQTGLTYIGALSGIASQAGGNKTLIGISASVTFGLQSNGTGVGYAVFQNAGGNNGVAVGTSSQLANGGSRGCSMGRNTLGTFFAPNYDDCIAIGNNRLQSPQSCVGVIDVGSSATEWPSGDSNNVVHIGTGVDLSSNINNVVALGSGTFAGAAVTNNTFAIADDITQWRSFGLSVSASANILQFDPVTGLITQAASSRRFKENIEDVKNAVISLESLKVRTYEINGETDRGIISEEVPEIFATFDSEGRRNGVVLARFVMALLGELQEAKTLLEKAKAQKKGLSF